MAVRRNSASNASTVVYFLSFFLFYLSVCLSVSLSLSLPPPLCDEFWTLGFIHCGYSKTLYTIASDALLSVRLCNVHVVRLDTMRCVQGQCISELRNV